MIRKIFCKMYCNLPCSLIRNQKGQTKSGLLFTALVVGIIGYSAYQIVPFYYYYYEILGHMEAQARKAGVITDDKIRKYLLKEIERLQIPLEDPDKLRLTRFENHMTIEMSYQEVFYVDFRPWGWRDFNLWIFDFHPKADAVYEGKATKR